MSPRLPLMIDLQATQSVEHGERGIARYAASQTSALLKIPGIVSAVFLNPALPFPKRLDPALKDSPLLHWNTSRTFRRELRKQPGAFYVTSPMELCPPHPECLVSPHTVGDGVPLVATLYDLIPLQMPERYLMWRCDALRYRTRLRFYSAADLVLSISEHTRREAIRLLGLRPDRVFNIGGGADDFFREPGDGPASDRATVRRIGITKPYVITVLGQDPRKNYEGLVAAFAALPPKVRGSHQLVVVGKYDQHGMWLNKDQAQKAGLREDEIVFTGRITDEELRSLYREARLFVFPSLNEGFGLPVAEALACGCPAIASNTTSLPEILEWEPGSFDPIDITAMAAKMADALADGPFRSELVEVMKRQAPVHTWARVAQRTVEALDCLKPRMKPRPSPTTRIALIGPVLQQHSGVADYNARVIEEMSRRAHVDVYTEAAHVSDRGAWRARSRVIDQHSFGWAVSPDSYDGILYTVGNSWHYNGVYDLMRRFQGVCWFHDVRLYGLYLYYARQRNPGVAAAAAAMRAKLNEMYPGEVPDLSDAEALDPQWYQQHGEFALTAELTSAAELVIVHSNHALEILKKDLRGGAMPPHLVVPHAIPSLALPPGPRVRNPRPLLATFGIVHPVKAPDLLIEAIARLKTDVPVDLVMVGPIDDPYREELEAFARANGVAERVTLTGRLPYEGYVDWLFRADCAVQLRRVSHGENSGSISDCISAGVPVLTNSPTYLDMGEDFIRALPRDVTSGEIASQVAALLKDPRQLDALRKAGRAYAEKWTFKNVVSEILASIADLAR